MSGSCFSENISAKLRRAKFNVESNPFGIMFNPLSIAEMFSSLASGREFSAADVVTDGNLWFSYAHHGSFSDVSLDILLSNLNEAARQGRKALDGADTVIITFGTAWIYRLKASGEVVANCHKQPMSEFARERLTVDTITECYSTLLNGVLRNKTVIFTLSPVRHLKDGFEENSLSKAILRTAIGGLAERYDNVRYFPAYEMVNDDLRDYRFYADDMLHPSQRAVEYIWEKFKAWALDDATQGVLPQIDKLALAMEHRVLNEKSEANGKFFDKMSAFAAELQKTLPGVDFSVEEKYFNRK